MFKLRYTRAEAKEKRNTLCTVIRANYYTDVNTISFARSQNIGFNLLLRTFAEHWASSPPPSWKKRQHRALSKTVYFFLRNYREAKKTLGATFGAARLIVIGLKVATKFISLAVPLS